MMWAAASFSVRGAGKYITKLPKAEHEAAEWQAAMEALILVATLGGPTMFARIGVIMALNRHVERASFGLGATALNYLEVPSPIRRHLSRNSKSKRGIHNLGSAH
jgi:hypothetical protein